MEKLVLKLKSSPIWTMFFIGSAIVFVSCLVKVIPLFAIQPSLDTDMFLWFLLVGFVAQTIDGALGMAYGVSSNSLLLGIGIPPAVASAWVHFAQVFTSLASGISHWKVGNVKWTLAKKLLVPGVLGAILGALLLSHIDGQKIKPFIGLYLLVMGLVLLRKVFIRQNVAVKSTGKSLPFLASIGGFADAIGGGGWGPIVNGTLMGKGQNPRFAIGTGNFVEIFVSLASASTFIFFIKELNLAPVLGLIVGGVIAAPFAAIICKKIKPQILLFMVALLIIFLSIRILILWSR